MFEWFFKYPLRLYREGTLTFSGPYGLEWRILGAIALAAAVWWLYRRLPGRVGRGRRVALTVLRAASMVVILLLIVPPLLRTRDTTTQNRFTVFLVDDSRSMGIQDAGGKKSRLAAARKLLGGREDAVDLAGAGGLLRDAAALGGVRVFRFADTMDRIATLAELKGQGESTDLYTAIKAVDDRLRGVPLAAVVIISDGGHTAQNDPLNAARLMTAKGVPIYTLGLGDANPPADREVVAVSTPRIVRRPSSVDVVVTVGTHGYKQPYVVRLLEGDKEVGQAKVVPQEAAEIRQVKIPLYVNREGIFTYTVQIPPEPDEKVVSNNTKQFRLEIQERRLPVLYVEGSPRTEYRFVRGALLRDKDFRIVTALRTGKDTKGKDRYFVQGAESDPAMAKELLEGFPRAKERLLEFEAVILGDIEAGLLTLAQQAMLEEFVAKHGGGVLMLGGVNSFNAGGYAGTPVAKMLPVELAAAGAAYDMREFHVKVAEKGVTHPIMHQADDAVSNVNIWNTVSPLLGHNPVKALKPGAVALLQSSETGEPILAVQNYGSGRTAAFTTGGSWFWRMDRQIGDKLHERFWRQLIRWLSVGAQVQLTVQTDKDTYLPGEAVLLQTTVLGKNLEPVNDATVTALVESPSFVKQEVPLEWILSEEGVYQGRYIARDQGEYKVTFNIRYAADGAKTESHARFGVREAWTEFTRSWQNQPLLKELAAQTDGKYYDESSAGAMAEDIRQRLALAVATQGQVREHSLWDMPLTFGLLLLLVLSEWSLRRRFGLP
jgi:uncharacterized membrane protein